MGLPKSIKRQLEEAEALQQQIYQPQETPAEPEEPAPEPAPVEATPAAPEPDLNAELALYQQRYRTLQGEFNAKVPQLQAALKERDRRQEELEARLRELESARPVERLVTEKDEQEFGADMLDLIERRAREVVQERERELTSIIRDLQARLDRTECQLGQVTEETAVSKQEAMVNELTQLVPNWREVNTDPGFLEWLNGEDQTSGVVRQELLNDASSRNNARRIAAIFNAYLTSLPQAPAQDTLRSQQAPRRDASASPAVEQTKGRIYSVKEVEKFYDDAYRRNIYSTDKRAELEAEINLAIAEGRVAAD